MKYKYDRRDQKIFRICSIVFSVLLLAALCLAGLLERAADINTAGIIAVVMIYFLPVPTAASWICYLDCSIYIKKLAAGGVDVPQDKRLEPLMPEPPVYENEQDSKESTALAVICFAIAGLILIHTLVFFVHWDVRLSGEGTVMAFGQLVVVMLWCVGGFVYLHQRLAKYYRDDTVFDPGRKVRTDLLKGILTIIVMLAITAAVLAVMHSMTRYVYHTRMENKYGDEWREHDGEPAI